MKYLLSIAISFSILQASAADVLTITGVLWQLRGNCEGHCRNVEALHRGPGHHRSDPGAPAQERTEHSYATTLDTTHQGSTWHVAAFQRDGLRV